jgi:hypothetical protein
MSYKPKLLTGEALFLSPSPFVMGEGRGEGGNYLLTFVKIVLAALSFLFFPY